MMCSKVVSAGLLLAVAVSCSPHVDRRQNAAVGAASGLCSAPSFVRRLLTLENGRPVYVEPSTLADGRGDLLLAGIPNYVWHTAAGRHQQATRDSLLGVVIRTDGGVDAVLPPIAGPIGGVRAVGRPNGGWDVLFAKLDSAAVMGGGGEARGLWHGVYDGQRWHGLVSLPINPGRSIDSRLGSSLVRAGGDLAFSVPMSQRNYGRELALYVRRGTSWTLEMIPVINVSAVDIAFDANGSINLAIVQPDSTLRSDQNSLFLYQPRNRAAGKWLKLASGGLEPIHDPALLTGGDARASWWASVGERSELRTTSRSTTAHRPINTVDSNVHHFEMGMTNERTIWTVGHVEPGGSQELRLFAGLDTLIQLVMAEPSPFAGFFAATADTTGLISVVGPRQGSGDTEPVVTSLLLRTKVTCESVKPDEEQGALHRHPWQEHETQHEATTRRGPHRTRRVR